jgi:hypothetical protein
MSKIIKTVSLVLILALSFFQSFSQGYDSTRIYRAMAKARRGEPVRIVALGGSITAGSLASLESKRWVNLMTAWWKTKFPNSSITLINSGIGGTGSDIGVHRLQRDVFSKDPDFVTVEFSVNDAGVSTAEQTMEGLIRQLVSHDSLPGVMMLLLKMENGQTAKEIHKLVGKHYNVPMICFADSIGPRLIKDGKTLAATYGDNAAPNVGNGIHPNDLGMSYIASFMIAELERIYATLPADSVIPLPNKSLPTRLVTTLYDHTYTYSTSDLAATENNGWNAKGSSWTINKPTDPITETTWTSSTVGSEIVFDVDGNGISLLYSRHNSTSNGQVNVWVDNGTPTTIDAYWTQTWGPAMQYSLIANNLPDGIHKLHVKIIGSSTSPSTGNFFQILNVLKAGNISVIAPMAIVKAVPIFILNGGTITLNGSGSNDPQGKKITAFKWSIISAPNGSTATIPNDTDTNTFFNPIVNGNYEIGLKVCNGTDTSVYGRLKFNVRGTNGIPVANPGNDTTIATKKYAPISGLRSTDPENDPLSYSWTVVSSPSGSNNHGIMNSNSANAKIYTDLPGEYIVSLVVNDLLDSSIPQTIKITAIDGWVGTEINNADYFVQISPNPVNSICTVSYLLKKKSLINIGLYSLAGNKITEFVNQTQEQGEHELSVNIKSIVPSGIYFLQLQTADGIITKKIVLE